ncbi:anaerobic glycerol-3-phosphate dehydrogenase subunit GlpA [Salipaludibacillus daqingensis]|uniref:anaerobic glycerol-3-phosphate dehydrogenase subunit GlpA n=1 Tax=Salipaludibacillus daqingensis TaxID=3041001 RepID=UPI002476552E|nr:anaerobic glycerol-3-phosphate dehydrogenase subunit GlpA [Salipaludibacillus daqingensis]
MEIFETEVAVIGGGMTGVGVLRDLALRGVNAVLIEQFDLGHGTSTRNHGLLHSGGRYAVKDKEAAVESYQENLILKKTVPGSIEETGGLFVKVPDDPDDYVEKWVNACNTIGIPIEEVPLQIAFAEEPYLNRKAEVVYRIPDGAVDPFTMLVDVTADAVEKGARVLTYHEVTHIETTNAQVSYITVKDRYTGEEKQIHTKLVVNAAGPWSANIAKLANVPMKIINNKGMLTVLNNRINKQVINRLRMPGDADIFVPAHNVTIFGTTGINVEHPDDTSLQREEFEHMIMKGKDLIPTLPQIRMIRAFSGSRPLFQETESSDASGRNVTRGMALLDHEQRDGLKGFITITSGKLTTFRYMAEKTVDLVCEKLGITSNCQTAEVAVPHREAKQALENINLTPVAKKKLFSWAGVNASSIKANLLKDNSIVCECESVTWAEIESALPEKGQFNLGDIRRRTRLGMGPCQGTFCYRRAAAMAVEKGVATSDEAEIALQNGVEKRSKGMRVIATGSANKQLELMDGINYVSLGMKKGGETYV